MPDYQKMYYKAFNALTDAEKLIQRASVLIWATQQECEDLFVGEDDDPPHEDA